MNVDYFIRKFRSIPEALWTTGTLHNGWTHQHCAAGFCDHIEMQPLQKLFWDHLNVRVFEVNDKYSRQPFHAETPKKRILAALEYIKSL